MKRDRNVLYALACAVTLLVALVLGGSRGPSLQARSAPSFARSERVPQLLVGVAIRTVRARPAAPTVSPDCDRRAPSEHGSGGSGSHALPSSWFSIRATSWVEHTCSPEGARTDGPSNRAEWRCTEARAPPV